MIPPLCESYCPNCGNNHVPTTSGCLRLSPFESFTVPVPAPTPSPREVRCPACGGNGHLFDIAALRVEADEWYALFQHEEDQREKAVTDCKWLAWILEKAPHAGNCATFRRGMLDCDCFKALAKEKRP